jgi:hypothetical protein
MIISYEILPEHFARWLDRCFNLTSANAQPSKKPSTPEKKRASHSKTARFILILSNIKSLLIDLDFFVISVSKPVKRKFHDQLFLLDPCINFIDIDVVRNISVIHKPG